VTLATYDHPMVRTITVKIPDKFFLISAKRGNYFEVPNEGLHFKELIKYEEINVDRVTKVKTTIPKEKIVDACVSLISPYVVGFEYTHNYKQLLSANLADRTVTFRVFNQGYPDIGDHELLGTAWQLKSCKTEIHKKIFEVVRADSTHITVMAITTSRLGWDFNTLTHEHFESYFNPIV